ncbi:vWA domain-containing protein [Kaistia algarum]|uniref:vWA domain-containing protein n=1 Tax=Kaistia algarum TaxID=2083279 RepID=UPI0026A9FD53
MSPDDSGAFLADNIVRFGRMLRRAGLPVGPDRIAEAVRATELVGIASRQDFRAALGATLLSGHDQEAVFDVAFGLFWRSGHLEAPVLAQKPPSSKSGPLAEPPLPGSARAVSALFDFADTESPEEPTERQLRLAVSSAEALRRRDFAQMSADEVREVERVVASMRLPDDERPTRRRVAARRGEIDPRRTFRLALRSGGELILPAYRKRAERPPPVVALLDISGSMSAYSRIVLHFLHALSRHRRVETFLFGTRLTNVSRPLRQRDADAALAACSASVADWSGGTRIGAALAEFNRLWSRRVLGQGAIVLLVTDGLEREDVEALAAEADKLQRSCRRLVWLNPLLRYDGFQAKARGIRALLPYVDELRSIHSLGSVEGLVRALSNDKSGEADPRRYLAAA